jgi:hypothetical protein
MTESFVHVAMRQYLKKEGWTLVAGEYPGGSDDELYVLSIMDPTVARDNSPDPRRHSEGEIIPDLFAYKDGIMLVIEAKPKYSYDDKKKLRNLLDYKIDLLKSSLRKFCYEKAILPGINFNVLEYVPVLAFGNEKYKVYEEESGFAHIYVKSLDEAKIVFF